MMVFCIFVNTIIAEAKVVTVIPGIGNVKANTSSVYSNYHNHWQYWCQGASKYSFLRSSGCRVVAYSKMLREAGFSMLGNPDNLYEWGLTKGYYKSGDALEWTSIGTIPKQYIMEQGGTLTGTKISIEGMTKQQVSDEMMKYLNNGYYVIMFCQQHTAYVGRQASLEYGEPVILDSWASWSYNSSANVTYKDYSLVTFTSFWAFSIMGAPGKEYDLFLDPNGGVFSNGATTVTKASPRLIYGGGNWWDIAGHTPARDGYILNGWYTEPTGGVRVYDESGAACNEGYYWRDNIYRYAGNLTVYAQWSKLYDLYLDPNGGSFGDGNSKVIKASPQLIHNGGHWWQVGDLTPTRNGYVLDGWYTEPNGGTKVYDANGSACNEGYYWSNNIYQYAGDLRVYARWVDKTNPVIESAWIKDVDSTGYTVVCKATDNEEVARVCFPTWTVKNHQDDLNQNWYHEAAIIGAGSDGTYSFRVHVADHNNESGAYMTHVYAYDADGNNTHLVLDEVVVPKSLPFPDVKVGTWYYNSVADVYEKGYMSGRGDGNFGPDVKLTRAEIATVIYNMANKPSVTYVNKFSDVADGQWYSKPISWAYRNNIVSGYGNGKFGVGDKITREQMAQMLYAYARMKGYDISYTDGKINQYADKKNVSNWAKPAMNWAITKGIMSGKGSGDDLSKYKLDPNGNTTRAECAAMLKNFMDAYGL